MINDIINIPSFVKSDIHFSAVQQKEAEPYNAKMIYRTNNSNS